MKYFLLLIGFFISLTGNACVCMSPDFMEKYIQSDFVARITITKNFPNKGSEFYYNSNIVIHELYKGRNVSSISVEGSSDGKRRTSCDLFFEKGTEILVYAKKNEKGSYIFDSCSGYVVLNGPRKDIAKRELEILNFLKAKGITNTDKTRYGVHIGEEKLKAFQSESPPKDFAIFEISFSNDMKVDTITTVTGFYPELDDKLIKILKESRWVRNSYHTETTDSQGQRKNKLLFAFYYYPPEGKHRGFISEYYL